MFLVVGISFGINIFAALLSRRQRLCGSSWTAA